MDLNTHSSMPKEDSNRELSVLFGQVVDRLQDLHIKHQLQLHIKYSSTGAGLA